MDSKTNIDYVLSSQGTVGANASKTFLANVFSWMFLALVISAVSALAFAMNPDLMSYLVSPGRGLNALGMVVMFSPLAFVLLMSFGYNKLSFPVLISLFLVYSAITGISLSFIFLAYTSSSIALTFGLSAVTFGLMAITGYTTKTDLTKFGSIMMIGLVGLMIAMVVNMFLHSPGIDYLLSFLGVAVFTGLTAYDVQKLKLMSESIEYSGEDSRKVAVMGALRLYLDFINLFLFMLRLFGRRK